jgi:hypothetical protein
MSWRTRAIAAERSFLRTALGMRILLDDLASVMSIFPPLCFELPESTSIVSRARLVMLIKK